MNTSRRDFTKKLALATSVGGMLPSLSFGSDLDFVKSKMKLGLVTYLWAKDWDVPSIIKNCTAAKVYGVELRVEHAHGVHTGMSKQERLEVKKKFDDSKVKFLGMGTNEQYDSPDPDKLKAAIEKTKEFIHLSHDLGGTGVKVKPNRFHDGVPHEKTNEQIGKALRELAIYAKDYGQMIRLEVHGNGTQELPNIQQMMQAADHTNARICWNCNDQDLIGKGLEHNFNLVKDYLGDTVHVREFNVGSYPYPKLFELFKSVNYDGWILMENRTEPTDTVAAMKEQMKLFKKMAR